MTEQATTFEMLEQESARIVKELDIPPCPGILAKFNQEFHTPCPDLGRLAALIGTDIGLSAAILKTVNSPFYGLEKKASSVEAAIALLGLRASANLLRSLLLRRAFPTGTDSALESFWDTSTRIAVLAGALAARLKGVESDEAHTYVLFRDCGMLVMLRRHAQYAQLMEHCAAISGAQFTRIEDARFKFNHARVAFALARSWSLPEPLCWAIFYHHEFDLMANNPCGAKPANPKLVAFGLLAEQIAALHANQGLCPDWIGAEQFVLDALGIEPDQIVELSETLLDTVAA
jgi:HD-like signal output (HDOD) protein